MTVDEHAQTFAGFPVTEYAVGAMVSSDRAWAVRVGYEAEVPWAELFEAFVASPGADDVRAIVVGSWGETATGTTSAQAVDLLVAARDRLPRLEALFLGDIVMEEAEMSWIQQSNVSPLLSAYPGLTHFRVRGGNELSFGSLRHGALRALIVETGGMDASLVRQVVAADLPKLEHLELWLGDSGYGATWTLGDLAPLLSGTRFPALKTLALRNSEQADKVAEALADSPLLLRLEVLDLSMGTLGDAGAKALLASPAVKKLKRLELQHNYISTELVGALEALGVSVDTSGGEPDAGEGDRYVAVSE